MPLGVPDSLVLYQLSSHYIVGITTKQSSEYVEIEERRLWRFFSYFPTHFKDFTPVHFEKIYIRLLLPWLL